MAVVEAGVNPRNNFLKSNVHHPKRGTCRQALNKMSIVIESIVIRGFHPLFLNLFQSQSGNLKPQIAQFTSTDQR